MTFIRHTCDKLLTDPVLKAASVFEHKRWPSYSTAKEALEACGESEIEPLLSHYSTLFEYLGGDSEKVDREWTRLNAEADGDAR